MEEQSLKRALKALTDHSNRRKGVNNETWDFQSTKPSAQATGNYRKQKGLNTFLSSLSLVMDRLCENKAAIVDAAFVKT